MKNVLLIDDDSICNFINKKTLQATGRVSHIDTVLNGKEALGMFRDHYQSAGHRAQLPHLVLLDLNMPVMNGFDFLKEYNELSFPDKANIKIVVVSSSNNEEDIARAKALGAHAYLSKPLNAFAALDALMPD